METLEIDSLRDLPDAAEAILAQAGDHRVVAFYGEMGAGKTTLIRAICDRLGVTDAVSSPTFALVNHYVGDGGRNIYHFDFYRIDRLEEAFDLGYDEYFDSDALCLVEWPEKIEPLLPDDTLNVRIDVTGPTSRTVTIG
ncbi:MAG TPA: tRNA (adenosine(37)-N6)-threonylcarbamoyltransferase complex ATPase subunit type 1 TsaE [Candidatus Tidjanibacter faecipullorum]|uniref:tRNA threonylcarbamoyladenosine biosynthesis protein TsaE n=1 Tax=Candidatus Tidjanibacter faecipullorum TaxID=2838766 RepID=A0A9D2DEC8_9BACT|nr:tRNA (adenosine(37)-N6)-threonylcarbamoyltransferase complex ATPase subunit type 1 TsaE [Candidatus Tidjanibacter faecipullorum]